MFLSSYRGVADIDLRVLPSSLLLLDWFDTSQLAVGRLYSLSVSQAALYY